MKNNLPEKYPPEPDIIRHNRILRFFEQWLKHPDLWKLNKRSVAGAVAVGMFSGTIPGPVQVVLATLLAFTFRVNLPIAITTTFYSNPFTAVPIIVASYEIGSYVTGESPAYGIPQFGWQDRGVTEILPAFFDWISSLGSTYLIGVSILATTLAIAGYFAVLLLWRFRNAALLRGILTRNR
ncbi:MAG: DUF2062 domain-containing protein [Burkholderiales bacterium]